MTAARSSSLPGRRATHRGGQTGGVAGERDGGAALLGGGK